jgi:hypothetical protein
MPLCIAPSAPPQESRCNAKIIAPYFSVRTRVDLDIKAGGPRVDFWGGWYYFINDETGSSSKPIVAQYRTKNNPNVVKFTTGNNYKNVVDAVLDTDLRKHTVSVGGPLCPALVGRHCSAFTGLKNLLDLVRGFEYAFEKSLRCQSGKVAAAEVVIAKPIRSNGRHSSIRLTIDPT